MPKKRNSPARDWIYVTIDGRHIEASGVEIINELKRKEL